METMPFLEVLRKALEKYGQRLIDVGNDLWICSYPLIAVILLYALVLWNQQGTELTSALHATLSRELHFRDSALPSGNAAIQLFRMVLAVGYCSACIYVASYTALISRRNLNATNAIFIPLWLALACLSSSGGVFLDDSKVQLVYWIPGIALVLLSFLPRTFSGALLWGIPSRFLAIRNKLLRLLAAKCNIPLRLLVAICIGLLLIAGAAVFTAALVSPVMFPRMLTTWPVVYVAVGFWTLLGTLLFISLPRKLGFPSLWLVPLALMCFFGYWNDNHVLRVSNILANGSEPKAIIDVSKENARVQRQFSDHLFRWLKTHCNQPKCKLEIIAAEGGGLRAAYWTAEVLAQLDKTSKGTFSDSTFAVSGVSGGSIGATAYYAALQRQKFLTDKQATSLKNFLSDDYLAPDISAFVFGTVLQGLLPWPIAKLDRAWAFEDAFGDSWKRGAEGSRFTDDSFDKSFPPTPVGGPELFLNATNVESGKRFIISRLLLPYDDANEVYVAFSRSAPYAFESLSTKTAVHLSARFALVSPAATVYAVDDVHSTNAAIPRFWGRIVDGGYYDDSGLTTAFDVVDAISYALTKCRASAKNCPASPEISITYISNDPSGDDALNNPGVGDEVRRWPSNLKAVPPTSEVMSIYDAHFSGLGAAGVDTQRRRARTRIADHLADHLYVISLSYLAQAKNLEANDASDARWCRYYSAWRPALGWWLSKRSYDDMNTLVESVQPYQDEGRLKQPRVRSFTESGCEAGGTE